MSCRQVNDGRHYSHDFPESLNPETEQKDIETIHGHIRAFVKKNLPEILENYRENSECDHSVYTGHAGIAVLLLRLWKLGDEEYAKLQLPYSRAQLLELASNQVRSALLKTHKRSRNPGTFFCGNAGVVAVACVVYAIVGRMEASQQMLDELVSYQQYWLDPQTLGEEEPLYGRVGYLSALLWVDQWLQLGLAAQDDTLQLVNMVIEAGRDQHDDVPLMYAWHGKNYLGAAHGLAGILHIALYWPHVVAQAGDILQQTLDFLNRQRFQSGNFISSLGGDKDRLVQWCHGASGAALVYAHAYQVFQQASYLEAAQTAADVVWARGFLMKGLGLCHGVSGNCYAFLSLYRLTQDSKYLTRALMFAEAGISPENGSRFRTADEPYSLMEGSAGTLYYLIDLLQPSESKFPGFEF